MVTISTNVSPRAQQLLGAMRLNLQHLVELEKTDPAGVATIVEALVAHLRSWKPLAATAIPTPLALERTELVERIDAADAIERSIEADGSYRLTTAIADGDQYITLLIRDEGDVACGVFTPAQALVFIEDWQRVLAKLEALR